MNSDKPKILAVLGPTAVGKSHLAVEIANRTNGVIINADSVQVYKYLDIGTAKPSESDRELIPHHLIDIVSPYEHFNAGLYRTAAKTVINRIHKETTNIILVGGTYLYVKVLLYGVIEGIPSDPKIRKHLSSLKSKFGLPYVYGRLKSIDPDSASRIHPNDYLRIERALEVFYITGETMSEHQQEHAFGEEDYEVLKIGILEERKKLGTMIDERTDNMLNKGLLDEVKGLRKMGYGKELKSMKSIGYRQLNQYIDGEITYEQAVSLIKRDTKRLAKRQMTWLRKDNQINWFHLSEDFDEILVESQRFFS